MEANGRKKRKGWIILLIVLAILGAAGWYLRDRLPGIQLPTAAVDYKEYTVNTGTVTVTKTGRGILESDEETKILLPGGIRILDILVKEGDAVRTGDVICTLDEGSIRNAILEKEKGIASYASALAQSSRTIIVNCGTRGRLKAIYAKPGNSVDEVTYLNGSLALISTDGLMQVVVESEQKLPIGTKVQVQWQDGSEQGMVAGFVPDGFTVTLSDETAPYGAEARVVRGETFVGTGELEIHAPAAVYGEGGFVRAVHLNVNDTVSSVSKLYTLEEAVPTLAYRQALHDTASLAADRAALLECGRYPMVVAPGDGIVSSLPLREGDVTETDAVAAVLHTGGAVLMTVEIDETDVPEVRPGQSAAVTMDAWPEESFPARVARVSRIGKVSGSITVYEADLLLEGDDRLLEGMHGSAVIAVDTKREVLTIPVKALREDENGAYVYVRGGNGEPVRREVETGISDGMTAEITNGLVRGEIVLYTESSDPMAAFSRTAWLFHCKHL